MSTTFGVKIISWDEGKSYEDMEEVAFRSNGIRFTHPLAHLLPDDLEVFALDNTSQGINTIGDIKREILKGDNGDYYRTTQITVGT